MNSSPQLRIYRADQALCKNPPTRAEKISALIVQVIIFSGAIAGCLLSLLMAWEGVFFFVLPLMLSAVLVSCADGFND